MHAERMRHHGATELPPREQHVAPRLVLDRFWSKVADGAEDECWEWQASRGSTGYGQFAMWPRGMVKAHRFAWELTNGAIPPGMFVCHRCDNPLCVNPGHLFLGSHDDNMRDMWTKGRGNPTPGARAAGESHKRRAALRR